jgi:hypothetical protein
MFLAARWALERGGTAGKRSEVPNVGDHASRNFLAGHGAADNNQELHGSLHGGQEKGAGPGGDVSALCHPGNCGLRRGWLLSLNADLGARFPFMIVHSSADLWPLAPQHNVRARYQLGDLVDQLLQTRVLFSNFVQQHFAFCAIHRTPRHHRLRLVARTPPTSLCQTICLRVGSASARDFVAQCGKLGRRHSAQSVMGSCDRPAQRRCRLALKEIGGAAAAGNDVPRAEDVAIWLPAPALRRVIRLTRD